MGAPRSQFWAFKYLYRQSKVVTSFACGAGWMTAQIMTTTWSFTLLLGGWRLGCLSQWCHTTPSVLSCVFTLNSITVIYYTSYTIHYSALQQAILKVLVNNVIIAAIGQ